jgi:hypothetical protein
VLDYCGVQNNLIEIVATDATRLVTHLISSIGPKRCAWFVALDEKKEQTLLIKKRCGENAVAGLGAG